jgi:HK97 gp10 family phage protein
MAAVERLEWNREALNALLSGPAGPVAKDLLRRALMVESTAKRITSGPGHGRIYTRHGIQHQASAPGDPFATDTGRLRASITHSLTLDAKGLVARIGSDVEYALFVEAGTSKMEPRPYLRPALASAMGGV